MAPELSEQERALLGRCPLFLGAEDALLRRLPALPGVTLESFAAGDLLYGPSQFRRSLGVLLAGQVQGLLREKQDPAGGAGGEDARSPCRVLFLPQETLDRLLGEEPLLRRNYLRYLTGRVRFLSGRLRSVAQTGAEGKLARYLLTLPSGEPLRLSATDLAKRLGISRASLYRAFQALEDARLIRREGKSMYVLDPAGLEGVL